MVPSKYWKEPILFKIMGKGKLLFKYGTMGSGKSSQLLATAYNFQEKSIPCLLLKSSIDDRDGRNVIHSRTNRETECVELKPEDNIFKLVDELIARSAAFLEPRLKWILVDESQFLTESQVEQLAAVADLLNINIICYGLRTDFQSRLFPGSKRLFELADSIEEIKYSCSCDSKAIMNARIDSNGNVITEGDQIEIGGDDKYVGLCRKCYFTKAGKKYYINKNEENF